MIIQKLSDGSCRVKDEEFYNYPRVEAVFKGDFTGKTYKQRMNFPTDPYRSKERALEATKRNILKWAKERGESYFNESVRLISFKKA